MTDWSIPEQLKDRFTKVFRSQDVDQTGFLSGAQCRDILLQSGLPRTTLAEIWNLSDLDYDGQLNMEEFILAMFLATEVKAGLTIPKELPPELVPPSFRRTRSNTSTSIPSGRSNTLTSSQQIGSSNTPTLSTNITTPATTITSATNITENGASQRSGSMSVFTSNSFEDKRRENYEKGRAELERRRLKVVEEQIAIFNEQLAAAKKQVTEAKTEIDSMRTERDSKMGIITTLEAQLLSLQDRKSRLIAEESSLEAAAIAAATAAAAAKAKNEFKEIKDPFASDPFAPDDLIRQTEALKVSDESRQEGDQHEEPKLQTTTIEQATFLDPDPFNDQGASKFDSFIDHQNVDFDAFAGQPEVKLDAFVDQSKIASHSFIDHKSDSSSKQTKYRAIFAFEARNVDELTINPGDIITGTEGVYEPGWLGGQLNGEKGLFPESFVEQIYDEGVLPATPTIPDQTPDIEHLPKQEIQGEQNQLEPQQPEETPSKVIKYKAIFAFEARNVDELTINPGDIIIGTEGAYEPGWLGGELNGQKGLFPESFVEQIYEEQQPATLQRINSVGSMKGGKKKTTKKAEVATVIANYRALGNEQLNLEKGQLVMIRRKMDSGWWEGEVQVKGKKKQFGWFPASYVKLLSGAPS